LSDASWIILEDTWDFLKWMSQQFRMGSRLDTSSYRPASCDDDATEEANEEDTGVGSSSKK